MYRHKNPPWMNNELIFKKELLKFIRPKQSSIFNIFYPLGLKLLTRLRVNLSHLREHKSTL